jgi:peptide chain release factor subunit 1
MLEQATVDRLRHMDGQGFPVLSLYLGLEAGPAALRSIPTRIKQLLSQAKDIPDSLPRHRRMSLRDDIDLLTRASTAFASDLGRAVAIFRSSGAGIDEYVGLPGPVRDRAVIDAVPYLRPLDAMLEHYRRFCVAVVDRRSASIFRYRMNRLESSEERRDEEIRKANYGGFSGYEERRVRAHADEVLAKHYREVTARLDALLDEDPGYDLLIVGGPEVHTAGVVEGLSPQLTKRLAGTFIIDPHTMTPATVLAHSERVSQAYEKGEQEGLVRRLLDTAASRRDAVIGVHDATAAVNRRAVATLVVQADRTTPGAVCHSCRWISGPEESACPSCGGTMHLVPDIVDALGDSVRNSGGNVQYIIVDTRLAESEVGAFLRYQAAIA